MDNELRQQMETKLAEMIAEKRNQNSNLKPLLEGIKKMIAESINFSELNEKQIIGLGIRGIHEEKNAVDAFATAKRLVNAYDVENATVDQTAMLMVKIEHAAELIGQRGIPALKEDLFEKMARTEEFASKVPDAPEMPEQT